MDVDRLRSLYRRLYSAYGPQSWWPADDPFEMMVGAVLTQRTAWRNAEMALDRLRDVDDLSPSALRRLSVDQLIDRVRAAGFPRSKAATLMSLVEAIERDAGGSVDRFLAAPSDGLRDRLLSIRGIGEETADAILLYAAGRPTFVVDAYTRRILTRLGFPASDGEIREGFLAALVNDVRSLNEAHALIVRLGKTHCRAEPICHGCPIRSDCWSARADGPDRGSR